MANPSSVVETQIAPHRVNPERLAWSVLLIAFAVFCSICAATTVGLYVFLFQSTMPMIPTLEVGKGTVGLTFSDLSEKAVRDRFDLSGTGTTATTDSQTQGTLIFRDPLNEHNLIASVTLKGDSSLTLREAVRPRFEWATGDYFFNLVNFSGEMDAFVSPNIEREIQLDIWTPHGSRVALSGSGRYTIIASGTQVQVTNSEGQALLFAPNPQNGYAVPVGHRGVLVADTSEIILSPTFGELLENSTFRFTVAAEPNGELPGLEAGSTTHTPENSATTQSNRDSETSRVLANNWGCANSADLPPLGDYGVESIEGRVSLRLVRGQEASSHGESLCVQNFVAENEGGLDVSSFDYLALRTTFLINYQSLSKCGRDGSECPLMLRIDYRDLNGNDRKWFQGFYTIDLAEYAEFPPRCDSCRKDHEKINAKAWYSFDTGNLLTFFAQDDPGLRPTVISSIRFYASGHQYDVYVSEMSLIGG